MIGESERGDGGHATGAENRAVAGGIDRFREKAISNLGLSGYMDEVTSSHDLTAQLEQETTRLRVDDLFRIMDDDNPVYVRRADGTFKKARYIRGDDPTYDIHYGRRLHKIVSGDDILKWQDEARVWISERSKERDRKRDVVFESMLKSAEAAIAELKEIGASQIKQTQIEKKARRYGDFDEMELYIRKIIKLRFVIGGNEYQLSGITATTRDHDMGGEGYFAEWLVFGKDGEILENSESGDAVESLRSAGLLK